MQLLGDNQVLSHPAVIGELACGTFKNRSEFLALLAHLPQAKSCTPHEALQFTEQRSLYGMGIGWVDVQLLAAALLSQCGLWTHDRRLHKVAARFSIQTRPL